MLKVRDLMSGTLETVSSDDSLHEALELMNRAGLRHLPVTERGELVGVITDRDVRLALNSPLLDEDAELRREEVLDELQVSHCMTREPQTVSPDTPAHEVADTLSLSKFGAMPVVEKGTLVGMISYVDFLRHFVGRTSED